MERGAARARRAAIEEAIEAAESWEMEPARNPLGAAWHEGAVAAQRAIVDSLRGLLEREDAHGGSDA